MSNYELRYLPLFFEDLESATTYIALRLKNPKAADDLLDETEAAILERVPVCEDFEVYHSCKERQYKYYRIYVKNYVVYYVVIDDVPTHKIMEIRRFLFKGRDQKKLV